MGQEQEAVERRRAFRDYQVNDALFAQARARRHLHALPARQARRRSDRLRHGTPRSVVFDQAENRLHAQKALLLMLRGALNRLCEVGSYWQPES